MSATNMTTLIEDVMDGLVGIEVDWTFVRDFIAGDFPFESNDDRYTVVMCQCRMCEYEYLSFHPTCICVLYDNCRQCPHCEHMTSEPVTDDVIVVNPA